MVRRSTLSASLVLIVGLHMPSSVSAEIIVVNPEAYALGTNLSDLFPGLTMRSISDSTGAQDVRVESRFGTQTLGNYWDPTSYWACTTYPQYSCGTYRVLELTFSTPTSFFQVENTWLSDAGMIIALDQDGNRLASCLTEGNFSGPVCSVTSSQWPASDPSRGTMTIQRDHADISRILFGGWAASASAEEIRYSVPEPSTLGLVGLAVFAAGTSRRRATKRTD